MASASCTSRPRRPRPQPACAAHSADTMAPLTPGATPCTLFGLHPRTRVRQCVSLARGCGQRGAALTVRLSLCLALTRVPLLPLNSLPLNLNPSLSFCCALALAQVDCAGRVMLLRQQPFLSLHSQPFLRFVPSLSCHFVHSLSCHYVHSFSCHCAHSLSCHYVHSLSCHCAHVHACRCAHAQGGRTGGGRHRTLRAAALLGGQGLRGRPAGHAARAFRGVRDDHLHGLGAARGAHAYAGVRLGGAARRGKGGGGAHRHRQALGDCGSEAGGGQRALEHEHGLAAWMEVMALAPVCVCSLKGRHTSTAHGRARTKASTCVRTDGPRSNKGALMFGGPKPSHALVPPPSHHALLVPFHAGRRQPVRVRQQRHVLPPPAPAGAPLPAGEHQLAQLRDAPEGAARDARLAVTSQPSHLHWSSCCVTAAAAPHCTHVKAYRAHEAHKQQQQQQQQQQSALQLTCIPAAEH